MIKEDHEERITRAIVDRINAARGNFKGEINRINDVSAENINAIEKKDVKDTMDYNALQDALAYHSIRNALQEMVDEINKRIKNACYTIFDALQHETFKVNIDKLSYPEKNLRRSNYFIQCILITLALRVL